MEEYSIIIPKNLLLMGRVSKSRLYGVSKQSHKMKGIERLAEGDFTQQISSSIQEVPAAANELSTMGAKLSDAVASFKV